MSSHTNPPIGVFDSGVGGISVLKAIREQMPEEPVIYFGDRGHVPYGSRSLEQIQHFSEAITRFLLGQGGKIIVVACNTASAAALKYLREKFPDVPSFIHWRNGLLPHTICCHPVEKARR